MKSFGSPTALLAGFALLLAANAAILAAAGWNRWGGPPLEITLTERELAVPEFRDEENSGLSLSLVLGDEPPPGLRRAAWRKRFRLPRAEHPWLDRAKLRELGFRTEIEPSDPGAQEAYEAELNRRAFLVLEFEGEAWRRWLAAREERLEDLRRKVETGSGDRRELQDAEALAALDRTMRSRLFPVDAGLDLATLRRRHPDRARNVIVPGMIALYLLQEGEGPVRLGSLVEVLPDRVHVPAGIRGKFERFLPRETQGQATERERKEPEAAWPAPTPPRYRAVLAYGRRLEPWIVGVSPMADGAAGGR